MNYQLENANVIDRWCSEGWIWGQAITHEIYSQALKGQWEVYLTPTKFVP